MDLRLDRMSRDKGDAEPGDDGLLDGFVAADLRTKAWRNAGLGKESLHQAARPAARLANQERFFLERFRVDACELGQRVVRGCDDHMRVVSDRRRFDGEAFGRLPHDGDIELIVTQPRYDVLSIADDERELDFGVNASKGGKRAWGEILGGADDTHRGAAALRAGKPREQGLPVSVSVLSIRSTPSSSSRPASVRRMPVGNLSISGSPT